MIVQLGLLELGHFVVQERLETGFIAIKRSGDHGNWLLLIQILDFRIAVVLLDLAADAGNDAALVLIDRPDRHSQGLRRLL